MFTTVNKYLSKIDFRLSPNAYSRPQYQTKLIVEKLSKLNKKKFNNLVDIGGGDGQYKGLLHQITERYINLEIDEKPNVDLVGSIYKIPLTSDSADLITLFMVLEHLEDPLKGLKECHRVIRNKGYLTITTVQYWHTHNYPSDYYRYTKEGLIYLCEKAGFKIEMIWSHGGPFLVVFHAIEINLPDIWRTVFSILFYKLADYLDWLFFQHNDLRKNSDSVGWSVIAKKI